MYFTRAPKRSDLEGGRTFAHGMTRLNLAPADLEMFVDPPDAAMMFGFRALEPGEGFEKSFAIWMVTLRRRGDREAIVESLQRIFPNLCDEESIVKLFCDLVDHARALGYGTIWLTARVLKEPLLIPALKKISEHTKNPVGMMPSTGMCALNL